LFEVDDGNGGDAHELSVASSATLPTAAWSIIGLTIDETGGAGASRWFINGTHETFNGAYNTPSASAASHPMAIGSRGNGAALLSNGAQIAFAGFIQGTALGQTDFDNIFALMRGRYGI
jgi:hypothetical protein